MNRLRDAFVRTADLWTARHFGVELSEDQYLHAVSTLGEARPRRRCLTPTLWARLGMPHGRSVSITGLSPSLRSSSSPDRPAGFDVVLTNPPYVRAIARAASSDHEAAFLRERFDAGVGSVRSLCPLHRR